MPNLSSHEPAGLLISQDLIFTSKVTGTAAALGLRCDLARDTASGLARLQAGNVRCVLCDLSNPGLNLADLMAAMPACRPAIVAFGSHVNVATLQEARDAGCTEVMPRSRFSAELPDLLRRYVGKHPESGG